MSHEKAASVVWDILSVLFQIGGFFLAFAGLWIIVFDTAGGFAIALNSAGPSLVIAGIFAFIAGSLMDVAEARRREQSYLLPSLPEPSTARMVSPPRTLKASSCPSCGYENDDGGFFCIACNAPLWPAGKPTGPPLPHAIVMRRIGRVLMMRRVKRISLFAILALVISAPLTASLAVSYSAINQSKLVLAFDFFHAPYSLANGTLYVAWMIYDPGFDVSLPVSSVTYDVRFNNVQLPVSGCSNPSVPASHRSPWIDGCPIVIPDVQGPQLNGTSVSVRVTALASLFFYNQRVTRSVSILCDSRCFATEGPWVY